MKNIRNFAMASVVCAGCLSGMAQSLPAIPSDPVIGEYSGMVEKDDARRKNRADV